MTAPPPLLPLAIFTPDMPQTPPPGSAFSITTDVQSVELPQASSASPPPTPTPDSSSAALHSARIQAISPPTPAPSPQPHGLATRYRPVTQWTSPPPSVGIQLPSSTENDIVQAMRAQFGALSAPMRQHLLSLLIADSPPSSLSPLQAQITPRLKRDFLKTLPIELAFHVLSFVDDVRTLARASGVSRFWRALLEDEATWKRMCWKSGFGDADGGSEMDISSPLHRASRLRSLEFGERIEEDGTPAGRERRGTLDRTYYADLVAKAESLGIRTVAAEANAAGWSQPPPTSGATVSTTGATSDDGSTGLGLGATLGTAELAALQRPRASARGRAHEQEQVSPPFHQMHSDDSDGLVGSTSLRPQSGSISAPILSPSAAIHPPLQALVSPPLYSLSSSLPSAQFFNSPPPPTPAFSSARKPFSYKTHFKRAYLTESAWLRGPGRLLSTQMSADDGVVTSLGFDNEWIVVGMATSKVHIFEAHRGTYVKTLDGHELGVWCLTLVSKRGGPRDESRSSSKKGKARASNDDWSLDEQPSPTRYPEPSPMGASFSQPGAHARAAGTAEFADASPKSIFRRGANGRVDASPSTPPQPRRRRSFQGFDATATSSTPLAADGPSDDAPRTGGMGIGAGGETGDSWQQAGVCGTARGWGQPGAVVVSGGCDRDVRVWDIESGTCKHILRGHQSTVRCMRVLEGRPIAVSGSRDATLRVWNIETGTAMHQLVGHSHSVRCIEVSGNKVVSGSYDATCRLWDVDTGECLHEFRGHIHQIYAVAFDGIRVVTGSLDSTVRIWSAETGEFLALLQGHTSLVGQLQLDPISNVLVTGGSDGRVIVFSLSTFETIHRLCAHDNSVTCLQFDDRFIVTGGNDGRIKLWDFKTGAFIRELAEACDAVWRVTIRDDKAVILCRRDQRTLMDVRTFRPSDTTLSS